MGNGAGSGITKSGEKFRPNDWAERMSGSMSHLRGHRVQYIHIEPELAYQIEPIVRHAKLYMYPFPRVYRAGFGGQTERALASRQDAGATQA